VTYVFAHCYNNMNTITQKIARMLFLACLRKRGFVRVGTSLLQNFPSTNSDSKDSLLVPGTTFLTI